MTTKKYILTYVIFALLLACAEFLLFRGIFVKEQSEVAFYIFVVGSGICLASAVIFIAINFKKLFNFEFIKCRKKIDNLHFTIIDTAISESELYDKLIKNGYTNKDDIFHKSLKVSYGDGDMVENYYAIIHRTNEIIDIQGILKHFCKGMTTFNIGYIFVNENVEANIEIIENYIKATMLDVRMHTYKYKNFFVPIVIANNKIYYINNTSIFMDMYMLSAIEGINVISK